MPFPCNFFNRLLRQGENEVRVRPLGRGHGKGECLVLKKLEVVIAYCEAKR